MKHYLKHGMVFLLTLSMCQGWLAAQEEPPAEKAAPAAVISDPLARDLVASNPTTPDSILQVLGTLVDLRQAAAGQSLLKRLVEMELDEPQLAALYSRFGSAFLLKLARAKELNPGATQFFDKMAVAAVKQARDPKHLEQAIADLKKPSTPVRAAAILQLRLAHEEGILALLAVLADGAREADFAQVSEALVILGGEGIGPLGAVFEGPDAALEVRVIDVLGRLRQPDAELLLYAPAFAVKMSAEVQRAARQALATYYPEATSKAAAAAAKLYTTAQAYDRQPPQLPTDPEGRVLVWHWDAAQNKPVSEAVSPRVAALDLAVRWARAARSIEPQEPTVRRLYFTVRLEAQVAREGWSQPLMAEAGTAYRELTDQALATVEDLLASALADGNAVVATLATQVLEEKGSAELLHTADARPSVLVKAVGQSDRRLRFAALRAVMKFSPGEAYPGSSFVAEALEFFMRASGTRRVLVADAGSQAAVQLAGLAISGGYDPVIATSRRQLLQLAEASADYEFVLVDMSLGGRLGGQVLQDLRRDPLTGSLPIALLSSTTDFDRAVALARGQTATMAFLRPLDPAAMQRVVGQITGPAMTGGVVAAEERLEQARQALAWVAMLSETAPELCPLMEMEGALIDVLDVPSLQPVAAKVLAGLGTHRTQRSLATRVNRLAEPIAARQIAGRALAYNIARHGTLFTSAEILAQYDRYNTSQREPAEVQQVLASILDAMEQYAADRNPQLPTAGQKPAK